MNSYICDKDNIRIDMYLADILKTSRTKILELIKDKNVLLNNEICIKQSQKLKINDKISILKKEKINSINTNLKSINRKVDIIYEDKYLLVVNKPSGLLTHPTNFNEKDTLVNRLTNYFKKLPGEKFRPGIVHRLDKETSGLLIVAKDLKTLNKLQEMIQERLIHRSYLALCHNNFTSNKILIKAPIIHCSNNSTKMKVSQNFKAKPAITEVTCLQNFSNDLALVECNLLTGRTHQIRVHLSYIKHPIYNDSLYGQNDGDIKYGQYLCAYKIRFSHPFLKKEIILSITPDKIFYKKLKELKAKKVW